MSSTLLDLQKHSRNEKRIRTGISILGGFAAILAILLFLFGGTNGGVAADDIILILFLCGIAFLLMLGYNAMVRPHLNLAKAHQDLQTELVDT